MGVFQPFIFHTIFDILGLKSVTLPFVLLVLFVVSLFPFSYLPCGLLEYFSVLHCALSVVCFRVYLCTIFENSFFRGFSRDFFIFLFEDTNLYA